MDLCRSVVTKHLVTRNLHVYLYNTSFILYWKDSASMYGFMNRWPGYATKFKGIALNRFSSFNLMGAHFI